MNTEAIGLYRVVRPSVNRAVTQSREDPNIQVGKQIIRRIAFAAAVNEHMQNQTEKEKLEQQAITDPLTGLKNRRGFDTDLAASHTLSQESKKPMTVVTLDVNGLKHINDEYGHDAGDDYLYLIARIIESNTRRESPTRKADAVARMHKDTDYTLARWGGDEFGVILWDADEQGVQAWWKRLSNSFKKNRITMPAGAAIYDPSTKPDRTTEELTKEADNNVYKAKALSKKQHENILVTSNDTA